MSAPVVIPKTVYGQRTDVKKNAHFITDSEIAYPCGSVVLFHNFTANTQKYFILPEKTSFLELLLVSPKKNLLAAMVNSPQQAQIHIYDPITLKRMRTLSLPPEATTKRFEWMDFSHDERFVMVITGEPDWMMLAFNWERGKIETSTKANYLTNPSAPVRQVVCSPVDSSVIAIFGQGIFRLMNMQETVWRQYGFQKAEHFNVSSCCFLGGDRIVCGTMDGLLLVIDLGELKFIFDAEVVENINARADKEEEFLGVVTSSMVLERVQAAEGQELDPDKAVRALTPLSNGFAFSCGPLVHFFEKVSNHKYKKRNIYEIADKDFRENQKTRITTVYHIAVNVSESKIIATTGRSQLYEVKLWGPEMDIAGKVPFKHLGQPLHTGPIGDLAMCYWKPIFMTCGTIDRTVRVWNYQTESLEMMKQYQEDIHSVSLHPTGLFAAVGFSDKLRFMVVLIDDLQVSREFPIRECPKSAFNVAGNLLAAVNRNVIQIYCVSTFQNLANLKGHNGLINSLQWTADDRKLVSCGTDGAIYEWDSNTYKRVGEIVNKGVSYRECAVTSNGKFIYAVGTEHYLKEIKSSNVSRMINLQQTDMNHVILSRSNLMMFLSGEKGWIMSLKVPIEEPPEYNVSFLHSSCVLQMKLTPDDRSLVTCSVNGTVCIWTLSNIEDKTYTFHQDFKYFDEILISKTDLEEKMSSIKDLTQRIHELEMEHAYQMRHTETIYEEKIKDIQHIYTQAIEELRETIEVLENNHNLELNNISSDLGVMKERHEAEMLKTEAKYNADLIVEYNKVVNLETLIKSMTENYESTLGELEESKKQAIEKLKKTNESKLYNLNKMVEEAREDLNKVVIEHEEFTRQIEDDNDREIENLKSKYEKAFKDARESNMRLKGESGVMEKKISFSQKEIELIQMEIIDLTADHEKFKQNIKGLEQEILDLKREIHERDLRIQDQEKKIYHLKKKNQEYETYKSVLDYRVKELKSQIEPRDKKIKMKKEQIAEMEAGLDELQKVNASLENELTSMRKKLNSVYELLDVYKKKCEVVAATIKNVKIEIFNASGFVQDYKKLKSSVKKLYFKYIKDKDFIKAREGDELCTLELQRQKSYLEEIVDSLDKQVTASKQVRYEEGLIYMEMNWNLMDKIYEIRKKLKIVDKKIQDLETHVSVKMAKTHSPRQIKKMIREALQSEEELKEECQIKMEEATSKATMIKEELNFLLDKINEIENSLLSTGTSAKKRTRETLKFDIPFII